MKLRYLNTVFLVKPYQPDEDKTHMNCTFDSKEQVTFTSGLMQMNEKYLSFQITFYADNVFCATESPSIEIKDSANP